MMKQLRILLIVIFFLHSKIGVAFNVHYCGKHIAAISWAFDAKDCGMEKKNLSLDFSDQLIQKTCCENDLIIEQNTSDQTQLEDKSQKSGSVTIRLNSTSIVEIKFVRLNAINSFSKHPPPSKIHLYKKNCSLIFYA